MSTKNKYLVRVTAFLQYLGSTLLVAIMQITINPLLAQNLSPTDYAIIGYYSSFNILFTPFITFFLVNYFIKKFFQVDDKERQRIKVTVLKLLVYLSMILSIMSLIGLYVYQIFFNSESQIAYFPYAYFTIFTIPITGIYSLKLAEYRLKREAGNFAKYTIILGVLHVVLACLCVVIFQWGATGRLLATFLANLIMFITVFAQEKNCFKSKIDYSILKDIVSFCWPLVLAGMLGFFSHGYDKVLLERLGNIEELGYYSVGAQIAAYLSVFSNAVNSTFQPDLYECYSKKNFKKMFGYVAIIVGSISFVVIIFIVLAPYIINLLTAGRYTYSTSYAQIIALSSITAAIYYSSSQISIAMGYTKLLLMVKIVGGVLSIFIFYWTVNVWGFTGAAYGCMLSYLAFFFVNMIFLVILKRKDLINSN